MTSADLVVGVHADAVHGRRVKLHNVGLVVGGRDLTGGVFELPRVYERKQNNTAALQHDTSVQYVSEHCVFGMQKQEFTRRMIWTHRKPRQTQEYCKNKPQRYRNPFMSHSHLFTIGGFPLHISLTRECIFNAGSQCNSSKLEMETKQRRTRFILVLDVVAGYDAVAVEPLRPSQVHAPIFDLSNLQLRGIRGFCEQNENDFKWGSRRVQK